LIFLMRARRTAAISASISRMVSLSVPRRLEAAQVFLSQGGRALAELLEETLALRFAAGNPVDDGFGG
jgi:hypothetical protein